MTLSVNVNTQVSLPYSPLTPPVLDDTVAHTPPVTNAPVTDAVSEASSADKDLNQTQARDAAGFSPTDKQLDFGQVKSSATPDTLPELSPLKVDPPVAALPELENGKSVLRGDALQARLLSLGTQTTNGITALSERKTVLTTELAKLTPASPDYKALSDTLHGVEKAVEQLTDLQAKLSSSEPKAVAALQELLVEKDNGTAEEEAFEERLTYEKTDGSKATFDNLYGKRTDAGIRDYIARLVEETRTEGPHAKPPEIVTADPVLEPEVTRVEVSTTETVSLQSAVNTPAVVEEMLIPSEKAMVEAEKAVAEVASVIEDVTVEDVGTSEALHQINAFLDEHGGAVAHLTVLRAEFDKLAAEEKIVEAGAVAERANLFIEENGGVLKEFESLYKQLDVDQQSEVGSRIQSEVERFLLENPGLIQISAAAHQGLEQIQLASLSNWNQMSSTLYGDQGILMA